MQNRKVEEETFIERKRQWKSGMDQKMGPSMMITVLPAIVMCVFLVMAGPYLRQILADFLSEKPQIQQARQVSLKEAPEKAAAVEVPGNPEHADAEFYQKLYDEQGINWREKPVMEEPEKEALKFDPIEIKPIDVEIPATMLKTVETPIENDK